MNSVPSHGHLFVINSRLEGVGYDAAVIPTDNRFSVGAQWSKVTGEDPAGHRPSGWPAGFGRSQRGESLWFVDVARPTEDFLVDLSGLLIAIARAALTPVGGRVLPRVVLPVLGVRGGGHDSERGAVVEGLLDVTRRIAEEHALDVVIVALDPSDYAALQSVRRSSPSSAYPHLANANDLAASAANGDLALFIGAGVSIPAGLPSWEGLVAAVAADRNVDLGDLKDVLDQAELLRKQLGDQLGEAVAKQIEPFGRPSLAHAQLAALGCSEVVTTNFDHLYERAASNAGRPVRVLPRERPTDRHPWLLKLHGDISEPAGIVLARRDFASFGSDQGPAGAVLESLMMTRHLLLVGTSLTDANVLRLAHEVMRYRNRHGLSEVIGTVLSLKPEVGQGRLWAGDLKWFSPGTTDASDLVNGRNVEVFLDHVAMFAATTSPYLLDPRYSSLLSEEGQTLSTQVSKLLAGISELGAAGGEAWQSVSRLLREHGARTTHDT